MRRTLTLAGMAVCAASPAASQTHVGDNPEGGLHWSVAAPGGASWNLDCRFTPVTWTVNRYERRRWANRIRLSGAGRQTGRLPIDNGWCRLTKTGGDGPVGISLVRGTEISADGSASVGETAAVGLM